LFARKESHGYLEDCLHRRDVERVRLGPADVRLPDGEGISVCREIRSNVNPPPACLMLTSFGDDEALFDAIMAGAAGYVCLVDDSCGYRKLLDESLERLKARGVVAEGYLATGNTLDQIAAYAKRLAIDLIVLGHYPQPAGGFWWSGPQQRASLAERVGCCVFVAVSADNQP